MMQFIRELFKPVNLKTEQELRWELKDMERRHMELREQYEDDVKMWHKRHARIKQQQYTAGHYNVCPKSHT